MEKSNRIDRESLAEPEFRHIALFTRTEEIRAVQQAVFLAVI
jgi:hypothetical protein